MMAKQHRQVQKIQLVIPLAVIRRNRAQIALAVNHLQMQPLTQEIQLNQTALRAPIAQQILQVNQTAHRKQMKQQRKTQRLVMTKQQRIYRQTIVMLKIIHLQIKLKVILNNQKKNLKQINKQKKRRS